MAFQTSQAASKQNQRKKPLTPHRLAKAAHALHWVNIAFLTN
jgi:hypothetical protein